MYGKSSKTKKRMISNYQSAEANVRKNMFFKMYILKNVADFPVNTCIGASF